MTAPIIVTGGCGFIGSHVVRALVARGDEVLVVGLDGYAAPDNYFQVLRDPIRAVIHLGAATSTTETDAELVLSSNQLLSAKVWKYCRDNGVPLIYASSASVYGAGLRGFSECLPLDMNAPLSLYADSKRWFDNYALRQTETPPQQYWRGRIHHYDDQTPPHWCGLRLFNVYGDGEAHKGAQQSVVSKWIRSALGKTNETGAAVKSGLVGQPYRGCEESGETALAVSYTPGPIELFKGSGDFRRDFVFVDDVVKVILWALDNPPPNGIYNVGTGEAATFLDTYEAVRDGIMDSGHYSPVPDIIPMPDNIAAHYQKRTKANITKLRAAGYDAPFLDIFEGARLTAQRIAIQ